VNQIIRKAAVQPVSPQASTIQPRRLSDEPIAPSMPWMGNGLWTSQRR